MRDFKLKKNYNWNEELQEDLLIKYKTKLEPKYF